MRTTKSPIKIIQYTRSNKDHKPSRIIGATNMFDDEQFKLRHSESTEFSIDETLPVAQVITAPHNLETKDRELEELKLKVQKLTLAAQQQEKRSWDEREEHEHREAKLLKLQAEQEKAARDLAREEKFSLTKRLLLQKYDSCKQNADLFAQSNNFDPAIVLYNQAVEAINELNSAWVANEKEKNYALYKPENEQFSFYIASAKLGIIECLMAKKMYSHAYTELKNFKYINTNHYKVTTLTIQCKDHIRAEAESYVVLVSNIQTRDNLQLITEAKSLLLKARKLFDEINERTSYEFNVQEQRISWDEKRNIIYSECKTLLNIPIELDDYTDTVKRMRFVLGSFAKHNAFLDDDERDIYAEITAYSQQFEVNYSIQLERKHDIDAQISINSSLEEIKVFLSAGNIPKAYSILQNVRVLAQSIKTDKYITAAGLTHTHHSLFLFDLEKLSVETNLFKRRAALQADSIVNQIINAALVSTAAKLTLSDKAELFGPELDSVKQILTEKIHHNWSKLDQRSDASINDFVSYVSAHIAAKCIEIGYVKKWLSIYSWLNWSHANICLSDADLDLATIKSAIDQYVPMHGPSSTVQLQIFANDQEDVQLAEVVAPPILVPSPSKF